MQTLDYYLPRPQFDISSENKEAFENLFLYKGLMLFFHIGSVNCQPDQLLPCRWAGRISPSLTRFTGTTMRNWFS